MPQGLYVMAEEPQAGKSAVMLGLMELLTRSGMRVGFFRPLVRSGEERDRAIELAASRYNLPFSYNSMFGCTHEEARTFVSNDRYDDLLSLILNKYKALEDAC